MFNLLIPVLCADALMLLFSNNKWERRFMVNLWELLNLYAEQLEKDDKCPGKRTSQEGSGPVYVGFELFGYTADGATGGIRGLEYLWTDDQYRLAILVLRSVSHSLSCYWAIPIDGRCMPSLSIM